MVCKEEVCTWFKDLQGPKRLEFMCGLLQMCLPLELRFIGSCVEDLAKKDYYYLRDAENRANDPQEVKKLTDIFCRETRGKINTYIALLHSSNTLCSNSVFNTLMCTLPTLQKHYPNLPTDSDFSNEIILSLTMAAYHPSFTFSQRHRIFTELIAVRKLLEDQSPTDCSSMSAGCSSSKHIAVSASPNNIICSKAHSNGESSSQISNISSSNNVNSNGNISSNSDSKTNKSAPDCNDLVTNSSNPTVFVQNLEVKGSQLRQDRKNEFIIQVTWSDGQVTKAYRTYQQLHQFHTELIKLFPKDSGAHKQERQIPFFPQEKGPSHSHSEMESHIKKYIRQLSVLQDHIVQCEHVTTFFRCTPPSSLSSSSSTSPFLASATTSTSPTLSHSASTPLNRASMTSASTSPLTIKVDPSAGSSSHSPRSISASHSGNNSPAYSCSPYPLLHGSPSSSTGSSLPSPSSPRMSPCSQMSQGPLSPGSSKQDIGQWLKKIRLHKYTSNLCKYNWEDLLSLTVDQLEEEGLTAGARNKFLTQRRALMSSPTTPNGVINFDRGMAPQSPLSPNTYFTPPQSCMAYPPPPLSDTTNTPTGGESGGNLSGIDCSSASSDYSVSPPKTPDLEMKQDSLSSEETDRDMPDMEGGHIGKPVLHDGLLPPPNISQTPLAPELTHFPMRHNGGLLGMPPIMRDGHPINNAFHQIPTHMDMKTLAEALPLQYPVGVRPLLPFIEPSYFTHRHVRPPRSQVPPGVKPMTLSNNVGSTTTPVMPTPKMPSGSSGVIYENGHHIPPSQSYSYVPNHSQGHVHPHGVPLGAVPLGHHPKVNGQYAEGASTPPSMTPSMTTAMISSHGAPPMSSMSGPVLARPSTLGTLASTSLTYSMPHHPLHHHVSVDSSGKQMQPPPQQGPPTPQHPQPPPVGSQPSPAAMQQNQVKSPASMEFSGYPNHQQQHTPPCSTSTGYNSPTSTPGLQRGNPPTPPAAGGAPLQPGNGAPPPASGAPPQHHVPPPRTGTPSNNSSCSSCGCHGNCNNPAPVTPTSAVPPPYPYTYTMWPAAWHHLMHGHVPYLAGGTNGLINPSLQFPQIPPTIPNGLSSEMLYSNHHNFVVPGVHSQGQNAGGPFMAYNPNQISVNQNTNSNNGNKKAMCYNCGQGGHRASECEKPTMETMTHSGSYHLKIRPKSQDSE